LDAMNEADRNAVCGPWSDTWQFITSPAPEPKLPYDPDWAGIGKIKNLKKEEIEKLKWCEIDDQKEWQGADGKKYKYFETTLPEGETRYSPLSYKIWIYYKKEEGGEDLCHPVLIAEGKCHELFLRPAAGEYLPPSQFWDKIHTFFTKSTPYAWKVAACMDYSSVYCTDYSQFWRFSAEDFTLEKPTVVSPPNDKETPVGLPVLISWERSYAMSWIYEISGIESGKTSVSNVSFDWPQLKLDTLYNWKVQPCWDFESKDCQEDVWSDVYKFRTTGRPPNPDTMKPAGTDIPIPVNFEWESVPGAKSFIFKISGKEPQIVKKSKIIFDYPDLYQKTDYSWQVQTCARDNGNVCGAWSSAKTFKTFKLSAPASSIFPEENRTVFTYEMPGNFSWESVPYARYYKYTINYVSKSADEATEECHPQEGIVEKIVTQPSDFVSLNCLGEYKWQVTACLNASCQEDAIGEPSPIWPFKLVQSEGPGGPGGGGFVGSLTGGLVTCGRTFDDPNTLWNERESCQIKHIFIMIKTIIDFLLWKLAPLLLVFLLVYTGAIYYLAMGAPEAIANVKSLWRAAGIGYGIIFFAWIIISFILTFFGYRVGIFGPWWQIPF